MSSNVRGFIRRRENLYRGGLLTLLMASYTILFFYIAVKKYNSFSFYDLDLAVINQAVWNASRGVIVSTSLGQSTMLNGGHVELLSLFLAPFYKIFPSPLTLLFLQSLGLAIGAWPIYLIGKGMMKPYAGFLLAVCYLMYPALAWVNLFEFHMIAFATPLILWMFYLYVRKRWGMFCVFVILSLACREDVAIPVFAVGIFALIGSWTGSRRGNGADMKWALLPLISASAWFAICVKFIQPEFAPEALKSTRVTGGPPAFYDWLGSSFTGILKTFVSHPGMVWNGIVIAPKLTYLLHLFAPLAFLPVFSPSALLMPAISLVEGLISQRPMHFSIRYQYS